MIMQNTQPSTEICISTVHALMAQSKPLNSEIHFLVLESVRPSGGPDCFGALPVLFLLVAVLLPAPMFNQFFEANFQHQMLHLFCPLLQTISSSFLYFLLCHVHQHIYIYIYNFWSLNLDY